MTMYTPELIMSRHAERIAALIAAHGGNKFAVSSSAYWEANERLRAEHVVAVAQRDGLNVAKTLRAYFVSEAIVAELGYEVPPTLEPPRGAKAIDAYVAAHIDEMVTVAGLATACDCSEQTVRTYIKTNRSQFRLVERGTYLIIDEQAARREATK